MYEKLGKNLGDKVDFEISGPQKLNNCYKVVSVWLSKRKVIERVYLYKKRVTFCIIIQCNCGGQTPTSHDQI